MLLFVDGRNKNLALLHAHSESGRDVGIKRCGEKTQFFPRRPPSYNRAVMEKIERELVSACIVASDESISGSCNASDLRHCMRKEIANVGCSGELRETGSEHRVHACEFFRAALGCVLALPVERGLFALFRKAREADRKRRLLCREPEQL